MTIDIEDIGCLNSCQGCLTHYEQVLRSDTQRLKTSIKLAKLNTEGAITIPQQTLQQSAKLALIGHCMEVLHHSAQMSTCTSVSKVYAQLHGAIKSLSHCEITGVVSADCLMSGQILTSLLKIENRAHDAGEMESTQTMQELRDLITVLS